MAALIGYEEVPGEIREQIEKTVEIWKRRLGSSLVGIYLHGSLALRAFNPDSGDIDLLIVVEKPLDISTKLEVAGEILGLDQSPRPLEMSAILLKDAQNWKTPGNCVFHYSDFWTEQYREKLLHPDAECYVADREFPDADVTGYIRLIRQCGIVLYGRAIEEVFCDISDEDFWEAISDGVEEYDFHSLRPRYLASNVLILGRILSFREERRILSKYEGGLWMTEHVPKELKYLPGLAMKIWYDNEQCELPEEDLEKLKAFLIREIRKEGSLSLPGN